MGWVTAQQCGSPEALDMVVPFTICNEAFNKIYDPRMVRQK